MTTNWIDAAALVDVPEGDVIGVQVGDEHRSQVGELQARIRERVQ